MIIRINDFTVLFLRRGSGVGITHLELSNTPKMSSQPAWPYIFYAFGVSVSIHIVQLLGTKGSPDTTLLFNQGGIAIFLTWT